VKRILHLFFIIVIFSAICFAQAEKDETVTIAADADACEQNSAYFDRIANKAYTNKERIFVIFRAGKGETEDVNAKRLIFVKTYLEQIGNWKILEVVYARGEKTDAQGRVEFYIGGRLFLEMLAQKNKTPCLTCCGDGAFANPINLAKKKKRKVKIYKK
jgi:hypothetical protein